MTDDFMKMATATAYYRNSSATNVGADKDSLKRQQEAVTAYATTNGIVNVQEYYDAAISEKNIFNFFCFDPITIFCCPVIMNSYNCGGIYFLS
ncbi:hypothetical protein A9Q83_04420 [Alphaproteobacteria bacterium 46_93_T64]|nr:hypothetical protein A9Q83_04420 [Alphaproteobacteria bacterium 46_93_T64]